MTLDELLRSAAEDVAGRAPDVDMDARVIQARGRQIERRRRVGVVVGAAVVVAMVAVGLQAIGGDRTAPDPIDPSPTPSPTALGPADPVVTIPEIGADDLRGYAELATVTNEQPEHLGATELVFDVTVTDRFAFEYALYCDGDRDTWYVLIIGNTGASASGYCDFPAPVPFPTFPDVLSPLDHSGDGEQTIPVRMYVTGPLPKEHADCFEEQSPTDCQDIEPPLEPLETTDVVFGVSIYEYWAPPVAEVLGERISARARAAGTDHVLSEVLSSTPGQASFVRTLPATAGDRLVTVVTAWTDAGVECAQAAEPDQDAVAECLPDVQLSIGRRTVLLDRREFGEVERLVGRHGFFRVPGGRDLQVEVRVPDGDPVHVEYALLVFDEQD
jgi:hypothetical protein